MSSQNDFKALGIDRDGAEAIFEIVDWWARHYPTPTSYHAAFAALVLARAFGIGKGDPDKVLNGLEMAAHTTIDEMFPDEEPWRTS